jgi:pimeloyl-ACP methyl ester carboxylesterase
MLVPNSVSTEEIVQELVRVSKQEGVTRQMLAVLRAGIGFRGVRASMLLLPQMDRIATPTLVCWGTRDPLFPLSHGYRAVEGIPNAQMRIFEGAGHWPFYERTAAFNEAVLDHFERAESGMPEARASA